MKMSADRAIEFPRNISSVFFVTALFGQRPTGSYILRVDAGRRIISCISNARPRSPCGRIENRILVSTAGRGRRLDTKCHFVFGDRNALSVLSVIFIFVPALSLFACLGALNGRRYAPYSA